MLKRYIPRPNSHPLPAHSRYLTLSLSLPTNPTPPLSTKLTPSPTKVWIKRGLCSADSLINIALCFLGFIPGLLHAWYIIAKYPEAPEDYEPLPGDGGENGAGGSRVTYYYVSHGPAAAGSQQGGQQGGQQQQQKKRGYGTNDAMRVEQPKQALQAPGGQWSGTEEGQEGSSGASGVPPSYEQAVKGDHKVQT